MTEPSTPEPSTPEPSTPEPSAPEPSAPEPSAPEPSAPEPSTRKPSAPSHVAPRPKRRFGMSTVLMVAALGIALGAIGTRVLSRAHFSSGQMAKSSEAKPEVYQCPMHPTVVQDHPGECPICGMKLVKVEAPAAPTPSPANPQRTVLFYRSPMDPTQTSPTPRKDEMGMDYLPVYTDEVAERAAVPGMAAVTIDPDRQQLIGLTTTEATLGPIGGAWRTAGRVAVDETRVRRINLKISGFVERIFINFVGQRVRKGDALFTLYSPELLAAQEEYLLALKTQAAFSTAGAALASDGDQLVESTRRKLSLWDVSPAALEELAKSRQPSKTLTFYSPVAGVVTKKDVVEGMRLDAGAMPYEIVDLSSIWVLADVYESELRFVRTGMQASLTLNAYPNRTFTGKVAFMDPILDARTRTVKVRIAFANPTGELRPEMFGEVVLQGKPHAAVRVPQDAIIDSGTDKVVFVALGDGKFQPRKVQLGVTDASLVEVVDGVAAGEKVVTRANFLVDSESRLRASLAELSPRPDPDQGPESARVLPAVSEPSQATSSTTRDSTPSSSAPQAAESHP